MVSSKVVVAMKNEYRIVKTVNGMMESQVKYWWFPLWWFKIDYYWGYTSENEKRCELDIEVHNNPVVKYP